MDCKLCGSTATVRNGRRNGAQRWRCKNCSGTFLDGMTQREANRAKVKEAIKKLPMNVLCHHRLSKITGLSLVCVRRHLKDLFLDEEVSINSATIIINR